ncbi:MAG: WYL domain-containing transcriptional regulator [Anaerolineales bacterium]|nr:WYL domain-containing transcriptional regulator [Anaerolineales bacterium]
MSQRQQLERLLEIDRQLRADLYPNAERIAAQLEVSKRVIYSDKRFMVERLGAPITLDRERGGWCYTDKTWVLPGMFATEGELLAFFLSVDVTRRYLGTAFETPLRSAVGKLAASLGDHIQVSLDQLSATYTIAAPESPTVGPEVLMDLQRAIREQHPVKMTYYTASRDEWNERTVHPHHLYNMRGDWYLFAFDQLRQEMRNFHAGRIGQWHVLGERFERVPGFSARQHMETAFQNERGGEAQAVAIRFGPEPARYIRERRWHASQAPLEEQPDGGVILRMAVGGLGEVKRWVMQYGAGAEVLAPAGLRREVARELHAAAQQYAGAG